MPGRQIAVATAASAEEIAICFHFAERKIFVDRLARLLCDLERNGMSRLSLAPGGSVDRTAMRCNVTDPETDEIAPNYSLLGRKTRPVPAEKLPVITD